MSIDEVRTMYAPPLSGADRPTLASPEAHGRKMRYRFQRAVGTKGQSCVLSLSLTRSLLALCSF
jgi:hypothetical protein